MMKNTFGQNELNTFEMKFKIAFDFAEVTFSLKFSTFVRKYLLGRMIAFQVSLCGYRK